MDINAITAKIKEIAHKLEHDRFLPKHKKDILQLELNDLLNRRNSLMKVFNRFSCLADIFDKRGFYNAASIMDEYVALLTKSASICTSCKNPNAYLGYNEVECPNPQCRFFSQNWANELEAKKPKQPTTKKNIWNQIDPECKKVIEHVGNYYFLVHPYYFKINNNTWLITTGSLNYCVDDMSAYFSNSINTIDKYIIDVKGNVMFDNSDLDKLLDYYPHKKSRDISLDDIDDFLIKNNYPIK